MKEHEWELVSRNDEDGAPFDPYWVCRGLDEMTEVRIVSSYTYEIYLA